MPAPCVLVVIGPSGAGKSTLVRALQARGVIEVTPTWTTRPRREDELRGCVEHRFAGEEEFTALERAGFFLAVVRSFGLRFRYGLPAVAPPSRGRVPAIVARAAQLPLVERLFPDHVIYHVEGGRRCPRGPRRESPAEQCAAGRAAADRVFVNGATVAGLVEVVATAIAEDFKEVPCGRPG